MIYKFCFFINLRSKPNTIIKPYFEFNEVEDEIKETVKNHPIVYKLRTWGNEDSQRIISHREAWFAHPYGLNDPQDVLPPYNFIADNINWDKSRAKFYAAGKEIGISDDELNIKVEAKFKEARENPIADFNKNRD